MPTVTVYATGAGDWAVTAGTPARTDNTTASETVSSGGPSTKYDIGYWRWVGASFPVGAVSSATLHLVCESTDSTAPHEHPVNELTVDPVDSAYASALPPNDGDLLGVVGSSTSISATSLVQSWVDNPSSAYGVVTDLEYVENDAATHTFSGYDTARVTYTYSTNTAPTVSMLTADALSLPVGTDSVQLQASVTDPNAGDTVTTKFFLSETSTIDLNTFEQAQATGPLSNSTQSVTFTNLSPGSYWWWVSTSDGSETSALQGPRTFTITNAPPSAPGAFTAPTGTVDTTHSVTHGTSTDPEGEQVQYEVEFQPSTGQAWQSLLPLSTSTSRSADFSGFTNSTTARVRVRAYDGIDYSGWTTSPEFTVFHNTAATISAVTPDDELMDDALVTVSVTDPDSQTLTVTFEIYNAASALVDTGVVSPSGPASGLQVSYAPPISSGDYQWRARVSDGMSTSGWTTLRDFRLERVPTFFGGASEVADVLVGEDEASHVYLGTDLVWERVGWPVGAWSVSTAQPYRRDYALQFTSEATGDPFEWEWDFGDGTTSTQQHPTKTYATTGIFEVQHRAKNAVGMGEWVSNLITVVIPEPVSSFTSNAPVPPGQQVQFTDTSTNSPTSWYWTFGDGTTSTQQNPTKTYAVEGDYTVTLQASNSTGQGTLASETITIGLAVPVGLVAFFDSATLPTGWLVCDGTNGTPDMRDRFVVGSGASYTLGAIGGANTVTLSSAELASHSHNASSSNAGSHSHSTNSSTGASHSHGVSVGSHSHSHSYTRGGGSQVSTAGNTSGSVGQGSSTSSSSSESYGTNHSSDVSSISGNHSHSSNSDGNHSHNASLTSAGGGLAHENRPPYFALYYGMAGEQAELTAGTILMSDASSISGWSICNGAGSTPNLVDRFPLGAGLSYSLNATGGSNTVALSLSEMPTHNHNVSMGSAGSHSHSAGTGGGHSHNTNFSTHGNHSHTYSAPNVTNTNIGGGNSSSARIPNFFASLASSGSGSHNYTHLIQDIYHTHNSVNSSSNHNHSISSSSVGSSTAHENRPPYRATNFFRVDTSVDELPSGMIAMFYGASAPDGWSVETSFEDRFPVGAGTYSVTAVGGSNAVTLIESNLPSHTHNDSSTGSSGAHSGHTLTTANMSHSHSGSTSSHGNHTHSATQLTGSKNFVLGNWTGTYVSTNSSTSSTSSHSHNASGGTSGNHNHNLNSAGSHSHNISVGSTGSGSAHENRPPYRALLFIKKD